MRVIDPGHIYEMDQLGGGTQRLVFPKRSGGAIQYPEEWPGVLTQEVARVLVDRTQYLNAVLPCVESLNAIQFLRMTIFEYEARAYRRKREKVNRMQPAHEDCDRPRGWRDEPYDDVPFNEQEIELRPVGADGHILL